MCTMCVHSSIIIFFSVIMHYSLLFFVILAADHEPHSCELEIAHSLRYQSMNNVLFFASPTVNDTGEMLCNSNTATSGRGSSIFISVGKKFVLAMSYLPIIVVILIPN